MGGREGDKVSNRELCRGCGRGESINTIERCGDGVCEIVCVLCKDKCVGDTRWTNMYGVDGSPVYAILPPVAFNSTVVWWKAGLGELGIAWFMMEK